MNKIYQVLDNVLEDARNQGLDDPIVRALIRRAFRDALACNVSNGPLAGYSNLTEAISAGEPIDWERLDGLKVQCVNPDVGTLRGKMDRDARYYTNEPGGWWSSGMDNSYTAAFAAAWHGKRGWTLWVEGEIPLRRKTADQLKVGTYFRSPGGETLMYVGAGHQRGEKAVYRSPEMFASPLPASEWEVLEEYGPFQKPEGK